jgi:hypothetical protein
VSLTLLYINSEAVIPAKAGIQLGKPGFRVKPGMTIKVKRLMGYYTSVVSHKFTAEFLAVRGEPVEP